MSECEHDQHRLGGYILDGLDPVEMREVEAHLERCPSCRQQHTELAGMPALLELARTAPPPVPERVRDRIVADATGVQVRRRWVRLAVAASIAAAIVGGLTGWQLAPTPAPEIIVALEGEEPHEAAGTVAFTERDDSVLVRLELEDLEPLPEPGTYEAWLYTGDRRIMSIGQLGHGAGQVTVELTADGSLEDFQTFWVTAEPDARDPAHAGETVLRAEVPQRP